MRNRPLLCLLLALTPTLLSAQATDPSQALKQRVAAFQAAWNTHDAAAVTAFFSSDGDLIVEDGPVVQGRTALQQRWHDRFAGMAKGTSIVLTVRTVRPLTSDVAVVNVVAKVSGDPPQGREMGSNEDRGTWVMVRQAGQWFISALRIQQPERPPGR